MLSLYGSGNDLRRWLFCDWGCAGDVERLDGVDGRADSRPHSIFSIRPLMSWRQFITGSKSTVDGVDARFTFSTGKLRKPNPVLWEKMLPEDSEDRMDTKGH